MPLRHIRGRKATMPTLLEGQFGITKDTEEFYGGVNNKNVRLLDEKDKAELLEAVDNVEVDTTHLATKSEIPSLIPEGSITGDKLAESSIGIKAVSFARLGKNKFEGNYIHKLILAGAPSIGATVTADGTGGYIAITRVEPGKTYTVSKSQDTDRFRIASCPNYPKAGDKYPNYWHDNETIKDKRTFTVGQNDIYLIVYVSSPAENKQPAWLQIEEGSTATGYSPPKAVLDLDKRSVEADMVKGYRQNGYVSGDPTAFKINMDTQKITTNATAHVTVGNVSYATGAGEWSFADLPTNSGVILYDPPNKAFRVIRMAEDIANSAYDNLVFIGVIRRDKKAVHINGLYTDETVRQTNPIQSAPKFIFSGDDNSDYVATDNFIDMAQQNEVSYLYQQYDSLMAAYPKYITKTQLGTTKNGNTVYRYDFKMPNVQYNGYIKPKILLVGGIHGHEKFATYGALAFFRDLCQRWAEQKSLRFLRGNVHFVFIPLLNPDGYALNQRKNGNGVDLARNFPTPNFAAGTDPNSENYAGPSANSENETKILTSLLSTEKDVFFTIDFHNYSTFSAFKDVLWIGTKEEKARKISLGFGQTYDMKVRQEFPTIADSELATTSVRALVSEASVTDYLEFKGQKGVIVEAIVGLGTTASDTQRLNADILGNYVLSVVRGYKDLV